MLWKISSQKEVYFMVKKGWFALHQFLCLCICDTFTMMKTHPNQLSVFHLNNISVKDLPYVWVCCQDASQGKFDVVPFFELKISQVASASLKSLLSPKAAVPLPWRSRVLLFVSLCPRPVAGSGTKKSKSCLCLPWKSNVNSCAQRCGPALVHGMKFYSILCFVNAADSVKVFWMSFFLPEYMAYIKSRQGFSWLASPIHYYF